MMQELNYISCGDYDIPDIRLPEEKRPIGRWECMHRDDKTTVRAAPRNKEEYPNKLMKPTGH